MSVSDSNSPAFTQMVPLAHHEAEVARLTAERDAALAGGMKVKPLVWVDIIGRMKAEADTAVGRYAVAQDGDWIALWFNGSRISGALPTIEAAQAAAQADYEARILSAIQPDPEARQADLSTAARDVLAERARQISAEGWTPEHDDQHLNGNMALAAATYAVASTYPESALKWVTRPYHINNIRRLADLWPWESDWWKPGTARRMLVKAAALILAEIERLDRAILARAAGIEGEGK